MRLLNNRKVAAAIGFCVSFYLTLETLGKRRVLPMSRQSVFPGLFLAVLLLVPPAANSLAFGQGSVSHDPVFAFMAAGDIGGGVLTPGTFFPPTQQGQSTFVRTKKAVQVAIQTSGLPVGAYTVWWVVVNQPDQCSATPCPEADVFFNPAVVSSVFWATGGVVRANGIGNFVARTSVGQSLGIPGAQHVFGPGLLNPLTAEVHNIIKYHGPASHNPEVLWSQTHTLLGSCEAGANAVDLGPPFGVHCFDPQATIHLP